jgi:porin
VAGWAFLTITASLLLTTAAAWSADASGEGSPSSGSVSLPDALTRITDPDGLRTRLEQTGIKFTFTYYGDAFANPTGGVREGFGYDGRFGTIIDGDLEKLIGWTGTSFHASIHQILGTSYSANHLDNLMLVSGIEAPPSTRLFNLWIEQKFGPDLNLRVGQFTAAQEFLVSQNASLFVNSTFGWPALPASDLPSGGPAYPEATPGARITYTANDNLTIRAAIFNGDPAGPGTGNPVDRDPYGLALRVNDPPFLIAEVAYAYNQEKPSKAGNPAQEGTDLPASGSASGGSSGLPGTVKLGAFVHTGEFPEERMAASKSALAGGMPRLWGDFAVYGVIDQMLWRIGGTDASRGLSLFARTAIAPGDRNLVDFYCDSGLTFKGLIESRPNDMIGLAFAYARISDDVAASERYQAATTEMPMPIQNFEAAIELTYQYQITDRWSVQPDFQYIIHPGGHLANPLAPVGTSAIPNAAVLGVRSAFKF